MLNNTCPSRFTAAAGTRFARTSFLTGHYLQSQRKGFTTSKPSSPTRYCWIKLSPIVQYSSLLPKSPNRVSVPMWLVVLSDQLQITGLLGTYPSNFQYNLTWAHQLVINLLIKKNIYGYFFLI